ncbi:RIKEN cDNA A930034L06, partial [Mus musculus]
DSCVAPCFEPFSKGCFPDEPLPQGPLDTKDDDAKPAAANTPLPTLRTHWWVPPSRKQVSRRWDKKPFGVAAVYQSLEERSEKCSLTELTAWCRGDMRGVSVQLGSSWTTALPRNVLPNISVERPESMTISQ